MAERYFLALLVVITAAGSLWTAIFPQFMTGQFIIALLLSLLGLIALVSVGSLRKAGALMPLYFVTQLAYDLFVFVTRDSVGVIFLAIALLGLVGLVVSFAIPEPRVVKPRPKVEQKVVVNAKEAKVTTNDTKVEVKEEPKKKKKARKKRAKKKA